MQLKYDLIGKGTGTQFVKAILDLGKNTYKFNERAIKIYEKLGFKKTEEFIWNVNGEEKEFIGMVKKY